MKTTLKDLKRIAIPVVEDTRGNLGFIQNDILTFDFKRVYYLFDVPSSAFRGGHAHIEQQEVLIALSGSFEVVLDDGFEKITILHNKPSMGLVIPTGIWRELQNFSSGAVCLVLASDVFEESDYIRDYPQFLETRK